MTQKGLAGRGEFHAAWIADDQLQTERCLKVADLPAQRRLGRMQALFRCLREAALLGDGDEIAQVTKFHGSDT